MPRSFTLSSLLIMVFCCFSAPNTQAQTTASETFSYVKIQTNKGSFTVKLYNDTPLHRDNFIRLVKSKSYDNLLFHRVIRNFMVQNGGAKKGLKDLRGTKLETLSEATIPAEIRYPDHFHKQGALAAARISDEENPEKKSDGIQFYVVIGQFYLEKELIAMEKQSGRTMPKEVKQAYMTEGGTPHLDGEYTVFGEVVEGMNTILEIQNAETDSENKPTKDIFIKRTELFVK